MLSLIKMKKNLSLCFDGSLSPSKSSFIDAGNVNCIGKGKDFFFFVFLLSSSLLSSHTFVPQVHLILPNDASFSVRVARMLQFLAVWCALR